MKIEDEELMPIALNGSCPIWEAFVQDVCAWENLPIDGNLWDIFVQEKTRWKTTSP
jgi:hypothetical protein